MIVGIAGGLPLIMRCFGMRKLMIGRRAVLASLFLTFIPPIVFYANILSVLPSSTSNGVFVEEVPSLILSNANNKLRAVSQVQEELTVDVKEPLGVVYIDNRSRSDQTSTGLVDGSTALPNQGSSLEKSRNHRSRIPLITAHVLQQGGAVIEQVTRKKEENHSGENKEKENKPENTSDQGSSKNYSGNPHHSIANNTENVKSSSGDEKVRQLRDQLIRAKVYLSASATQTNPQYIRELRAKVRDVQKVLGTAMMDSELLKGASDKLKTMEQVLAKGKQIHGDCSDVVKKLRAIVQSTGKQLQAYEKQTNFLMQLAAKTIPKGLHCLPLRLSNEYFVLDPIRQQFLNQSKLEDPKLHHYALFSDNVLAAAVVVNSTVHNAKKPENIVFHVVTDRLNYAAMRMWFLANPPGKATIQVQNVGEFNWLNSSYSPVLKQLGSQSMINYYFKTKNANSYANLKYRNPKYLSILNHLRFYLPEIFQKLNKLVFLDDDIVVQKDLSGLWGADLKGKVNGAVETCGESFHRFDRYLNFSNPLIAKNFDPRACGWAFGMNVFDLAEWRLQNITEIYHFWQNLNEDRKLWKLGSLPPGLITFYNRVFPLDSSWHMLGLGYNPNLNTKEIERAAVIHYNGNLKPWLDIGIPRYRSYWSKYVDYDQAYLRECNITP